MIDCKHIEYIDITPWHGDVFDHPFYKSFCPLKEKYVHSYQCVKCENYVPDYENLSDYDIQREFRLVKEKLEMDDRANPMSSALIEKLIERKNSLIEEAAKRNISVC